MHSALTNRKKLRVALDTNMLLAIAQFKVDVFDEIKKFGRAEFIVPVQVSEELDKLSKRSEKMARAVDLARQLMKKQKVKKSMKKAADADKALLALSREGIAIATNDRLLKKEIKKANGVIMFLRKKKFIEVA